MGYKVLRNLKSFTKKELMVPCLCMIAYLILYEKIGEGEEGYLALGLSFLFMILYTAIVRVIGEGKKSHMFHQILLFSVLTAELATSTIATVSLVAAHESFTGWDFYGSHYDEIQELVIEDEKQSPYGFERSEIYPAYICNQPALYNFKGISIFTSTARESFVTFIKNLGFHNNGINSMRNFGLTEVTGTLFGVHNMYDLNKSSPIPVCFEEVETGNSIRKCVNPDALSLGYMVDSKALEYHMTQTSVPFISTSAWVKSMGVTRDVFTEVDLTLSEPTGMTEGGGNSRTGYKCTFSGGKTASIVVEPQGASVGDHLYLYVVANKPASLSIVDTNMDTDETKTSSVSGRKGQILDLGYVGENTKKTVTVKFNESENLSGNLWIQCARLVEPAYQEMVELLSDEQLQVSSYDSTSVEGMITAKTDGALLLTIPYDENWTAMVDGVEAQILPIDDAFMAIRLTAGTHSISLKYYPAKFDLCVKISVAALFVLVLLTVIRKIRESISIRKIVVAEEQPDDVEDTGAEELPSGEEP